MENEVFNRQEGLSIRKDALRVRENDIKDILHRIDIFNNGG